MSRPKAIYLLEEQPFAWIYGPEERADLEARLEIIAPLQTKAMLEADPSPLAEAEVILSGWGCPAMDAAFLARAPALRLLLYGAGSVKHVVTDAFWERGMRIVSAWQANAVPVSEYTLSQILFCLKRGWHFARTVKTLRGYPQRWPLPGAYKSTVGLVSLGAIGRRVCELLRPFDLHVIAYDPFVSDADAEALGVERVELDALFRRADVVSLHTPWLEETEGMINGALLASMKEYASFINTSRGAVVNEAEMIEVFAGRPDLQAVLDVTWPEPPPPESPLYDLENVVLTPHIAGAVDRECRRMGRLMVEMLDAYLAGEPMAAELDRDRVATMA